MVQLSEGQRPQVLLISQMSLLTLLEALFLQTMAAVARPRLDISWFTIHVHVGHFVSVLGPC